MFKKAGLLIVAIAAAACLVSLYMAKTAGDNQLLRRIIDRLSADSRIAEVVVTGVRHEAVSGKTYTTIKFLEYDTNVSPLAPKYFTFSGNIIQFQSMVIRFDDFYVKNGHPLKGRSAYLFMKAFALTDEGAEVFAINAVNEVPPGYAVGARRNGFEKMLWRKFWAYALDPREAKKVGIRNAQIEAPGTKFIPGMIYTIKIEHDGGMRIDAQIIPQILKGEKVLP